MHTTKEGIGVVLSGSTTQEVTCQLFEGAERGNVSEGTLLLVDSPTHPILARVAQIIPYNAFYTEGDPFSEARRKELEIPNEIARRYEVCRLDLLMSIGTKVTDIVVPPQPGQLVHKIDPQSNFKEIFGIDRNEPKHIWIGSLAGYHGAPIPLNVENIPMHMGVFGVTGSGKSFTVGAFVERLTEILDGKKNKVSYPTLIIDAHGDYINYARQNNGIGSEAWIRRYVFPRAYANPNLRTNENVRVLGLNLDLLSDRMLAEMIMLYHKGTMEGSEQQVLCLSSLLDFMRVQGFASVNNLFLYNFQKLINGLNSDQLKSFHPATRDAVTRALESFNTVEQEFQLISTRSDLSQFSRSNGKLEVTFIDELTKEGGIAVVDFSADSAIGVDLRTKQLVMTYLSVLLFEQFTTYKVMDDSRYLLLLIEEAQNFVPDRSYPIGFSLAQRILADIATQGRKFGLSLCLITQRPSFVDRIVLSMCNTFFIHRISPEDTSFVKNVSGGILASLSRKLTTLNNGDLIVTGQMNRLPFPVLIHIPEESRKIRPERGSTNVVDSLSRLRGNSNSRGAVSK